MKIYLKGYYGHKNFGDELLLFGVINHLYKKHKFTMLYIEAKDPQRLRDRLKKNDKLLPEMPAICIVQKRANLFVQRDLTVFGGGELVTDARKFPYNGWTYIFWFFWTILLGNYELLGGIGTIKYTTTKLLYKFFLGRAQSIITREERSYKIAKKYNKNSELYHDFAYDPLARLTQKNTLNKHEITLVNCNPYMWSDAIKQKIIDYTNDKKRKGTKKIYFPAEIGVDDVFYEKLGGAVDELFDRTDCSLEETFSLFANARWAIGTRLHFLLLTDYFNVEYEPLIYQEKIVKVLQLDKD